MVVLQFSFCFGVPHHMRVHATNYSIVLVFAFMWFPNSLTMFILRGHISPWWTWGMGAFAHFQGLGSALLTLTKTDVRDAVRAFVTSPLRFCRAFDQDEGTLSGSRLTAKGEDKEAGAVTGDAPMVRTFENTEQLAAVGLPAQGPDFQYADESGVSITESYDANSV